MFVPWWPNRSRLSQDTLSHCLALWHPVFSHKILSYVETECMHSMFYALTTSRQSKNPESLSNMTHNVWHVWFKVVQKILYNADKWSCSNSQSNEEKDVIFPVILSWGSIWSLDKDLGESARTIKSYQLLVNNVNLICKSNLKNWKTFLTWLVSVQHWNLIWL